MRESPNGMASASQADSRGFDSRLPLHQFATKKMSPQKTSVLPRFLPFIRGKVGYFKQ